MTTRASQKTKSEDSADNCNISNRTVFTRDNLEVLRGINSNCIDLIYLDPPFNSNRNYAAPIGSEAAGAAFKDTWELNDLDEAWHNEIADKNLKLYKIIDASEHSYGKGMKSYLIMMAVRLMEMHRVLKDTGSIYLHCDPTAGHYLKTLMDSIFGQQNFRREIIWGSQDSSGFKSRAENWIRGHDTLMYYIKSAEEHVFNKQYFPLAPATLRRYDKVDGQGRRYKVYKNRDGTERRAYLKEDRGTAMSSVWTDIPSFQTVNNTGEVIGYPTRKPLALLKRIIKASSNEGDIILDPFCGCATACEAAEKLDRQWIGIDLSPQAINLVNVRMKRMFGDQLLPFSITARTDIPTRTDLGPEPPRAELKQYLYGLQGGYCKGCGEHFLSQNLTLDRIIPGAKGGTYHAPNVQLMCSRCNSIKGDRPMEYLRMRLAQEYGENWRY